MVEHKQGILIPSSPRFWGRPSPQRHGAVPFQRSLELSEPGGCRWGTQPWVSYLLLGSILRYKNACLAPTPGYCSVVLWEEIMDFFRFGQLQGVVSARISVQRQQICSGAPSHACWHEAGGMYAPPCPLPQWLLRTRGTKMLTLRSKAAAPVSSLQSLLDKTAW